MKSARAQSLVLIRHDMSAADLNPDVYRQMPNHLIPLAEPESQRLSRAGELVSTLAFPPERTCSWFSPYVRCRQSEQAILAHAFGHHTSAVRRVESCLLRELERGEWNDLTADEIRFRYPEAHARRAQLREHGGELESTGVV